VARRQGEGLSACKGQLNRKLGQLITAGPALGVKGMLAVYDTCLKERATPRFSATSKLGACNVCNASWFDEPPPMELCLQLMPLVM
jgi:hypothetical protein